MKKRVTLKPLIHTENVLTRPLVRRRGPRQSTYQNQVLEQVRSGAIVGGAGSEEVLRDCSVRALTGGPKQGPVDGGSGEHQKPGATLTCGASLGPILALGEQQHRTVRSRDRRSAAMAGTKWSSSFLSRVRQAVDPGLGLNCNFGQQPHLSWRCSTRLRSVAAKAAAAQKPPGPFAVIGQLPGESPRQEGGLWPPRLTWADPPPELKRQRVQVQIKGCRCLPRA